MSVTPSMAVDIVKLVPIKLTRNNYILWKSIIIRVLGIYDLGRFVDGSNICPEKFLADKEGNITVQIDPKFTEWKKQDQIVLICLNATISEPVLSHVIGNPTSRALWIALEKRFSPSIRSHRRYLKSRFLKLKEESHSVTEFLKEINQIADNLAAIGCLVDDSDLVAHMLHGLPAEYEGFVNGIMERSSSVTADELHGMILMEELRKGTKGGI